MVFNMNEWIKKSIELANSKGYLDNLFEVYPIIANLERELPEGTEKKIKGLVESNDKISMIKTLIGLEKFPIENPYIGSFRANEELLDKNPRIVDIIGKQLLSMGAENIIEGCKEPKKGSRQFGSIFQKWLPSLGFKILEISEFEKYPKTAFLGGSDEARKNYANKRLKCNLKEKGLDMLMKTKNDFIIGQAKFITTGGGAQDHQFNEAIRFVRSGKGNAIRVALLDGVVWFNNGYLRKIHKSDKNIFSSLLLKEFVESLG